MTVENLKAKFTRNAVPVVVATVVMALILVTVPLTSTPASVFGGYGWSDPANDPNGIYWIKYSSFVDVSGGSVANNEATLSTVELNAAAIQAEGVDFAGFTLDGVPAASWALSSDGGLVLKFKLDGLYAAGDVVTLIGKYIDGKTFTVNVTVK